MCRSSSILVRVLVDDLPLSPRLGQLQELSEVVHEFTDEVRPGPRGESMVLYDDFVDLLVVGSPRFVSKGDCGRACTVKAFL